MGRNRKGEPKGGEGASDSRKGACGCGKGACGCGRGSTGCRISIQIRAAGDVNIYNCTAPPAKEPPAPPRPGGELPCVPPVEGACLPVGLGAKTKASRVRKLERLLANTQVPSAMAAGFFHIARRFAAGKEAANSFEASIFGLIRALPRESAGLVSCIAGSVDTISPDQRDRMFPPTISLDPNEPLDPDVFGKAVATELIQRVGEQVFKDPHGVEEERPGLNRFFLPDSEIFPVQLRVCRISGLRTNEFEPPLQPGDYLPAELEQKCEFVTSGSNVQLSCEIQSGGFNACPGNFLGDAQGTCLRVPEVEGGNAVVLEGVNFMSIDAKVRLTAKEPGTVTRDVEAHVFGDLDTPLTEVVNGTTLPIRDCRVHDRLTFVVPEDLPTGVYSVQILIPNETGIPQLGDPIISNSQFIRVVPPPTARFTITGERLRARLETSPRIPFASDEVRLRVSAFPVTINQNQFVLGAEQRFASPEFSDVDSGDVRALNAVFFSHQQPITGLVMTVLGHEIDSDEAYEKQIDDWSELFVDYLKIALAVVGSGIAAGAFAIGIKDLLALGLKHPLILAVAALVTLAVVAILAAWAPADLIIEDAFGLTLADLDELTNGNFPSPPISSERSANGLKINITPLEKGPAQYREFREYVSEPEDSRYEIFYRYNRVV